MTAGRDGGPQDRQVVWVDVYLKFDLGGAYQLRPLGNQAGYVACFSATKMKLLDQLGPELAQHVTRRDQLVIVNDVLE